MALQGPLPRKRKASREQVVPGIEPPAHSSPLIGRISHDGSATVGSRPETGPDYPIPNFDEVYARMRHPETGFKVADRRWRLLSYSKCFVGSEAVEWMMSNLKLDRAQAIRTGQHLMDAGIIHHVTHSEPFSDTYYFFRFQEDDESSILNMKRVWDPSLPAREAVLVSKELLTRLACLCEEFRMRIVGGPSAAHVSSARDQAVRSQKSADSALVSTAVAKVVSGATGTNPLGGAVPEVGARHPASGPHTPVVEDPTLAGVGNRTPPLLTPDHLSLFPGLGTNPSDTSPVLGVHDGRPGHQPGTRSEPSSAIFCGAADDVDYSLLAKSEDFRLYALAAAELQGVQLLSLSHDERIAFFVNVYNALCLHCYIVQSAPTNVIRRWVFFRTLSYRIAGLDMSLDDIEHGILRGNKRAPMIKIVQQLRPSDPKCQHVLTKRDGRIHFVISAGTRSDPPIRILDSDNVQEQLHDATVEFLSHSVKIDTVARSVTLPRIFLWYADDFPAPESALLRWVRQYLLPEPSAALSSLLLDSDSMPGVKYENFEWCVSDTRFIAAVVRRKRRRLERERAAMQGAVISSRVDPVDQGTALGGACGSDLDAMFRGRDDPSGSSSVLMSESLLSRANPGGGHCAEIAGDTPAFMSGGFDGDKVIQGTSSDKGSHRR